MDEKALNRAKSNKNLKSWKKGQSGNPSGRPKIPDDIKEIRKKYTKETIQGLLAQCLDKGVDELEEILKDKTNKVVDHLVGRVALMGIVNGDPVRFNFILDRLIGKVTEVKEVNVQQPFIIEGVDGEKVKLGMKEKIIDVEDSKDDS